MGKASSEVSALPGYWVLQDAKARFSELVVIAAEDFRRLQGHKTGRDLIEAIQSSPHRDPELEVSRASMPVRDVLL